MVTRKSTIVAAIPALALTAAFGFFASVSQAQTTGAGVPGGPRPGMPAPADTDGDGFVSADEANAWFKGTFGAFDTNGDSVLSREEYLAGHMGRGPGTGPRAETRKAARARVFDEIDTDHDGTVSLPEFLQWHETRYQGADTNHDGKVSAWEFRAAMRK